MSQDYLNKLMQQYQQYQQQLAPYQQAQQQTAPQNPVLNFNFQQQQVNTEAMELQEFAKTEIGVKLNEEGQDLIRRQQEAFQRFRALKNDPTRGEQSAKIEELSRKLAEMEKRDADNTKRNEDMYNMMAYLTRALTGGEKVDDRKGVDDGSYQNQNERQQIS